jgi:hypothetical protein
MKRHNINKLSDAASNKDQSMLVFQDSLAEEKIKKKKDVKSASLATKFKVF